MILEILKHTPSWVFVLFFALVLLGYSQSKDRMVGQQRLLILPIAIVCYSLYGIYSKYGLRAEAWLAWIVMFISALAIGARLFSGMRQASYQADKQAYFVPGSWLPMLLIMIIFLANYILAVMKAQHQSVLNETMFVLIGSGIFGFLSGLLLSRSLAIWRTRTQTAS